MLYKKNYKLKKNKILKIIFKFFILIYLSLISIKFCSTVALNFNKEKELKKLQNNLNNIVNENKKIQNQINTGITEDYIVSRARNELDYIDSSEKVFYNVSIEK